MENIMSDISKNIQKAIAESLPEAHAGELKKFIDDANIIKEKYKTLKTEHDSMAIEYKRLLSMEMELKDLDRKAETIERENSAISLKTQLVEMREQHAKERIGDMKELT